MRISATLSGAIELNSGVAAFRKRVSARAHDTVEEIAERTIEIAIEEIIGGVKTGRLYETDYGTHQASAPGEYPADMSGLLARSFRINRSGSNQYVTSREVKNDAAYAHILEFGGFNDQGQYVNERPFLVPSYEQAMRENENSLSSIFQGGF